MNIKFSNLVLDCRKSTEIIEFSPQISYFHGVISVGKSSILRLIDYCLGGDLEMTPAISRELVSVELSIQIGDYKVWLKRQKGQKANILVAWHDNDGKIFSILAPISPEQNPLLEPDIFCFSDLLFHFQGYTPIKVRRSKFNDDSQLIRLSFRDIMWYCYLDQDHLDSSFFRLEDPFRSLKSRDVMRFITGSYTEKMNELEILLDEVKNQRQVKSETAKQMRSFLLELGYDGEDSLNKEMEDTEMELSKARQEIDRQREIYASKTHFVDDLRDKLKNLSDDLVREKEILSDLGERISEQKSLRAELVSSKFKLARIESASTVLDSVSFQCCPLCGSDLGEEKQDDLDVCLLCKSPINRNTRFIETENIATDLESRIDDLTESIQRHISAHDNQLRRIDKLKKEKADLDKQLTEKLGNYDSDYLGQTRETERCIARFEERKHGLERIEKIPENIIKLENEAKLLEIQIQELVKDILDEKNTLTKSEEFIQEIEDTYLESLLKIGVPGITSEDKVKINRRTWIPWIEPKDGDAYNFYNAGSGGKKTLLNVCYAISVHKVAAEYNLPLPRFLMIDTPMKNISEDVNRDLFSNFYQYLYTLARGALSNTQIIIVDKEYLPPEADSKLHIKERYMDANNPLISYYTGP